MLRRGARQPRARDGERILAALTWALASAAHAAPEPAPPPDPAARARAEAAELADDYPAALAAWRECARSPSGSEARLCTLNAEKLASQAADGYAGWAVLEAVRREYRTIGSDEALRRIEAALAAHPDSPAAPELRLWLVNESRRRGGSLLDSPAAGVVLDDEQLPAPTRAWVASLAEAERTAARYRRLTVAGAVASLPFLAAATRGPGPWLPHPAAAAAVLLGALPALFAAAYDDGYATGFLATGAVVTVAVFGAARAPAWLSVPGTLGGLVAVLGVLGWYPSLGW